jgi:hypothetical protein
LEGYIILSLEKQDQSSNSSSAYAVRLVHAVSCLSGSPSYLDDLRTDLSDRGIVRAIKDHDTSVLDFLTEALSFQGISDAIAANYIAQHGNVHWSEIADALSQAPSCSKLGGYWRFYDCRFGKGAMSCSEPSHIDTCPLPRLPLRNGHLNQMAYSLFFFLRDIADGDFVAWIEQQLTAVDERSTDRLSKLCEAIVGPLRNVYGVSDKTLAIALSPLLMAVGRRKPCWFEVGVSLIAVDTLVHNFLHRTGILRKFAAEHSYGDKCYGQLGCGSIIKLIATRIDAREFNPTFPPVFPRFVQHAIWRYCAASGLDVCNGNRIDDGVRCENAHCQLFARCDRMALNSHSSRNLVNSTA